MTVGDVREASLEPGGPEKLPGGALGQAGPFALLAAAALWLRANLDRLPERMPIHWNWRGEADRFVSRSLSSAGSPLRVGALVCLVMLAIQLGVRHGAPRAALRSAMLKVALAAEYLLSIVFCGIVIVSVSGGRFLTPLLVLAGAGVTALIVFTWSMVRRAPRTDVRNPAGWHVGIFYADRDDPAIFVPKRFGVGYTFNFGNPFAVLMMAALLLLPLIAVWLGVTAR
jgi:uncharacterized membrane protein